MAYRSALNTFLVITLSFQYQNIVPHFVVYLTNRHIFHSISITLEIFECHHIIMENQPKLLEIASHTAESSQKFKQPFNSAALRFLLVLCGVSRLFSFSLACIAAPLNRKL